MTTYQAQERQGHERQLTVRGITIEEAAQHAITRLYGRGQVALRVTGDPGMSGIFQGYAQVPRRLGGGLTSIGHNVHIG